MANVIKVTVENATELRHTDQYGTAAVIQLQSSATEGGTYADVTTAALVDGTRIYTLNDPAGTSSTWYRTRYENTGETRVSDWSAVFQAAPEGSGLLASVYDGKQRLKIDDTDTSEDENILEWLGQITDDIHSYCERQFTPDGATVYTVDGYDAVADGRCLPFPHGIRTLTTLEVASGTGGSFSTITDYFLRPTIPTPGWPYTQVWLSDTGTTGTFSDGYNTVRLTGTFGFAAVPAGIRNVALNLLVAYARERGAGGGDTITVGIGGERTFERALSDKDRRTLDRYRVRVVA